LSGQLHWPDAASPPWGYGPDRFDEWSRGAHQPARPWDVHVADRHLRQRLAGHEERELQPRRLEAALRYRARHVLVSLTFAWTGRAADLRRTVWCAHRRRPRTTPATGATEHPATRVGAEGPAGQRRCHCDEEHRFQ